MGLCLIFVPRAMTFGLNDYDIVFVVGLYACFFQNAESP